MNLCRVPSIKNQLGTQGLEFLEVPSQIEKEAYKILGLLKHCTVNSDLNIMRQFVLQYCKLSRCDNENAEDWICRLHIMAVECKYKQVDRCLKG